MKKTPMKRSTYCILALLIIAGIAAVTMIWRPAIDAIEPASREPVSEETMLRGGELAAAGMCVVCHTATDGVRNAGGHAMDTPFGTIYSTNITPDVETGIGNWSLEAFDRAMRSGIDREGNHLYPAFPYTAFTHMSRDDMEALYGYLMAQKPVSNTPPKTDLPFPFNIRAMMAGWNLLFLDKGGIEFDPDASEEWNRGKYMAQALGHCSACHSPRNALGAEKKGLDYFGGGDAEGWHAPALNDESPAPIAWTPDALYAYLRHGYSEMHGPAGASMAPVVREGTSKISDADTRALAIYVASYMNQGDDNMRKLTGADIATGEGVIPATGAEQASEAFDDPLRARAMETLFPAQSEGAVLFKGACLACHDGGAKAPLFGTQPPLWLNTNLYTETPDNLIRFVMDGVQSPAFPENGYMPAFKHSFDDRQITALVQYMRTDMAQMPPWSDLEKSVQDARGK